MAGIEKLQSVLGGELDDAFRRKECHGREHEPHTLDVFICRAGTIDPEPCCARTLRGLACNPTACEAFGTLASIATYTTGSSSFILQCGVPVPTYSNTIQ